MVIIRRLLALVLLSVAALIASALYYIEYELWDIEALKTVQLQVPLQVYTHDNKLMATFGEHRRIPIPYKKIPKQLIQAVLATEDHRYFKHKGVDVVGLLRATGQLLTTGRLTQGGSTITMQVARSFYLTRHKTFARKIREILLAIKIDNSLSKEKILELYLNKVFLGKRAYGVEAASEIYYGKKIGELRLDQYAMLAGIPQAPSTLNPLANAEAAKKRRNHVLTRMLDQGYITKKEYKQAIEQPLDAHYHDLQTEVKAPYAAEVVREQLEQMYGESIYTDGFKVYTTVDSKMQQAANKAVRDNLLAYDQRHGYRGSVDNLGLPSLTSMDEWQALLQKVPTQNDLEPVAVVEMTDRTVTVLGRDGALTIIPWSGLSWARTQIDADYLGPMPQTAEQIVQPGDVVYVERKGNDVRLVQIPKADAGLVAMAPSNGAILAMVGGFATNGSNFNVITSGKRQPGSSFKPFLYAAALDKGYTLATVVNDAPIVIQQEDDTLWRPQNDSKRFYGPTRLRVAITESRNLVSIRLLALMGLSYAVDYLNRFGFSQEQLPRGLSLALGTALVTPLQLTQGYAVFANGGYRVVPHLIQTIRNSHGEVIYQAKPLQACTFGCDPRQAKAPQVLRAETAFLVTSALKDVVQKGTGHGAKALGRGDVAGKTGTTNNQVDAWFAGFTPDVVTVTWVGFKLPQSLHEYGAQAALPIWVQFMKKALAGKPERSLPIPPEIVTAKIDPDSGKRVTDGGPAITEYFMKSALPQQASGRVQDDAVPGMVADGSEADDMGDDAGASDAGGADGAAAGVAPGVAAASDPDAAQELY